MRLRGGVDSGEDLVRLYEGTVAYKIMDAADEDVSASTLADVLHLPSDDEATLDS
jgi:hypothetical protein